MATIRKACQINKPDANVFPDLIDNQTSATNEIGNFLCYVLADGGADEGLYCQVDIPENYASGPKIIVKGLLDSGDASTNGALNLDVVGLPVADNETADAAFNTTPDAYAVSTSNYATDDQITVAISLSNVGTLAAGDVLYFKVGVDTTGTAYTGSLLLTGVYFEYTST